MEESARCSVCTRAPLVGESVTVAALGRRESLICGLCEGKPRAAALGEPVRHDRIRTAGGAATVKRAFPRPVSAPRRPAPASTR